jgi:hypothetical protein
MGDMNNINTEYMDTDYMNMDNVDMDSLGYLYIYIHMQLH